MAYIDKITNMRRMALISGQGTSGVIVWEGVNIEGDCLLKQVTHLGTNVMVITEEDLPNFCDANDFLEVKYQDPETDEDWEPRAPQAGQKEEA